MAYALIKDSILRKISYNRAVIQLETFNINEIQRIYKKFVLSPHKNYICCLPTTIFHHILSFLEWEYSIRLYGVCSLWNRESRTRPWNKYLLCFQWIDGKGFAVPVDSINRTMDTSFLFQSKTGIDTSISAAYKNITRVETSVSHWNANRGFAMKDVKAKKIVLYSDVYTSVRVGHPTCESLTVKGISDEIDLSQWPCLKRLKFEFVDHVYVPLQHPLEDVLAPDTTLSQLVYNRELLNRLRTVFTGSSHLVPLPMPQASYLSICASEEGFTEQSQSIATMLPNITSLKLFLNTTQSIPFGVNAWMSSCFPVWKHITCLTIISDSPGRPDNVILAMKLLVSLVSLTAYDEFSDPFTDIPVCECLSYLETNIPLLVKTSNILMNRLPALSFLSAPLREEVFKELRVMIDQGYPLSLSNTNTTVI